MFASLMKTQNSKLIGMDIGSYAVKSILLSKSSNGYKVESVTSLPLPQGAIVDNAIADVQTVASVIGKIKGKLPKNQSLVAAAVSGSGVISKTIYMNAVQNEDELEAQIEIEADNLIPYPLDEVSLDFEIIQQNENNPEKIDVLLIASRTELVEARVSAIEGGKLQAKVMDVEGYALGRAFELVKHQVPEADADKPIALVDIGASMLTMAVVHNGETIFVKEQAFGGDQFTQSIVSYYGMDSKDAELAKVNDELPRNYVFEVLAPFQTAMIQQIRRTLQIYSTSKNSNDVARLILSGGCSEIAGIDNVLSEELNIPAVIAQPFVQCEVDSSIDFDRLNKEGALYMVASGLALRSFC
ncbi:pilus assembly protein PilM [Psychrobium sp. 1_MG-2023]|uniref:pilus assembly protein PilM n=1 Tax=Psychrobium sp. 1_MG-2023 TaxID=3062624 RepID=UPI00273720C1|nr:pilus assembly protein PilM [Psychrobium sp. 1_MG-2023]MDP2560999.1 pilus assembly protein PilM [Psychrobium sp. 1_MG-2023]